jgi:hypothetical protein
MIFLLPRRSTAIFHDMRTLAFLALHGSPPWYLLLSLVSVTMMPQPPSRTLACGLANRAGAAGSV